MRGRTETGAPQNRPDRCRAHANAELAQLTLNPYASPARILPPETNDQLTYRRIERRTPGRAVPVSPLLPHQLTVPAKKRLRRNQKHRPAIPRQKPARSRKQQPVAPRKRRPPHRPPKHAQLVPEHRVLQLQRRDRRAPRKNANQPPRRQVNKEEQHHADPTDRPVRTSESEFPRPTGCSRRAHRRRGHHHPRPGTHRRRRLECAGRWANDPAFRGSRRHATLPHPHGRTTSPPRCRRRPRVRHRDHRSSRSRRHRLVPIARRTADSRCEFSSRLASA